MWGFPVSLIAGGVTASVNITSDSYIGDLWVYLGSPSNPVEVTFTVDGADAAGIFIPNSFHPASTFQFIAINNGRFIGLGGQGNDGGNDNGATGSAGLSGGNGGHAIQSHTFNINIDVDDGYLLGGGGGGGGGSYNDTGAGGTPGGGGGGGVGWGDAAGGDAGTPTGSPVAQAGTAGSTIAAGLGGNGGSAAVNDGGDGGGWGFCGVFGLFADPTSAIFTLSDGNGGSGGSAGSAFYPINGAVATLNGVTGETTLRSQNRIKGELLGKIFIPNNSIQGFHVGIGHASENYGYGFGNTVDGILTFINSDTGNQDQTLSWYVGNNITGSDYEVRFVSGTEGSAGWDSGGAADSWVSLGSLRQYFISRSNTAGYMQGLFEIRRADETAVGTAAGSGLLTAGVEYEN